jgi:hypothetical protein
MGIDRSRSRLAIGLSVMGLLVALSGAPARAQTTSASTPKTPFQCEKKFKHGGARSQCFNQLPGASCSHPLEAEKAGPTSRGASRYFKITFQQEHGDGETFQLSYAYAPQKNIGICPQGAIFKVSLMDTREHCERTPQGQEECSNAYDTKNISEPTTRSGGEFSYEMSIQPVKVWYLLVKGYFIHPPWAHASQRSADQAARATRAARARRTTTAPTTVAQCKAKFKHNPKQRAA